MITLQPGEPVKVLDKGNRESRFRAGILLTNEHSWSRPPRRLGVDREGWVEDSKLELAEREGSREKTDDLRVSDEEPEQPRAWSLADEEREYRRQVELVEQLGAALFRPPEGALSVVAFGAAASAGASQLSDDYVRRLDPRDEIDGDGLRAKDSAALLVKMDLDVHQLKIIGDQAAILPLARWEETFSVGHAWKGAFRPCFKPGKACAPRAVIAGNMAAADFYLGRYPDSTHAKVAAQIKLDLNTYLRWRSIPLS